MSNLNELQAKYDQLGQEIQKLKEAELAKKNESWPEYGDACWVVDGYYVYKYDFSGISYKIRKNALGELFRTKEEAERELNMLNVIAELRQCEGRRPFIFGTEENGWTLNWCILVSSSGLYFAGASQPGPGAFNLYFDSHDSLSAAVNKVGFSRIADAIVWLATKP